MKNRRWSLLQFFGFTVIGVLNLSGIGVLNLSGLLGRPFIENMTGGDVVRLIGTVVMFGLAIWCLVEYFFGRRAD